MATEFSNPSQMNPQSAIIDMFFPGFSLFSTAIAKYLKIDLNIYFPLIVGLGLVVFASQYINTWIWEIGDQYLMSTADVRVDDEVCRLGFCVWLWH